MDVDQARLLAIARAGLPEPAWSAAWAEGYGMIPEAAIAEALAVEPLAPATLPASVSTPAAAPNPPTGAR